MGWGVSAGQETQATIQVRVDGGLDQGSCCGADERPLWAQGYMGEQGASRAEPRGLQHPQACEDRRGGQPRQKNHSVGTHSQGTTGLPGRVVRRVTPAHKAEDRAWTTRGHQGWGHSKASNLLALDAGESRRAHSQQAQAQRHGTWAAGRAGPRRILCRDEESTACLCANKTDPRARGTPAPCPSVSRPAPWV